MKCLACGDQAVALFEPREIPGGARFGLCAHHLERAIIWAGSSIWKCDKTPDEIRELVARGQP